MDMVRRLCFGLAAVILIMGGVRFMSARYHTYRDVVYDRGMPSYEFQMLHTLARHGVPPLMFGLGFACLGMAFTPSSPGVVSTVKPFLEDH